MNVGAQRASHRPDFDASVGSGHKQNIGDCAVGAKGTGIGKLSRFSVGLSICSAPLPGGKGDADQDALGAELTQPLSASAFSELDRVIFAIVTYYATDVV
jgi:hypothetical protein